MRDVGPYIHSAGRVMDHENYVWVSVIFEWSGLIQVKKMAMLTISKGSMILRGITELLVKDQR